jgi:chromatin modification-related protein EAF6
MADNKQTNTSRPGEAQPTMAEYKKAQARVRDLVDRRRQLERRLVSLHNWGGFFLLFVCHSYGGQ